MHAIKLVSSLIIFLLSFSLFAQQEKEKKRAFYKDTTGAVDISNWLINAHGFIPLPTIITEPALGNFGVAIAPIFLHPKKRFLSDTTIKGKPQYVPPDITAGVLLYTANNSWGIGAARRGSWLKQRIRYQIASGYFNINMAFYRKILGEEEKFTFNFKVVPVYAQATRQIGLTHWYAGIQYLFANAKVGIEGEALPAFVTNKEATPIISAPGLIIEYDARDNMFSPNNGLKVHVNALASNEIFGSDFNYTHINSFAYYYFPVGKKLIGGLRGDYQQILGDAPFYMLAYIDMRGIPIMRYQGDVTLLTEAEARWDFYKRWSAVFYGGVGNAFNDWKKMSEAQWAYSAGTGFRYLIASKFKLRVGMDVARGPEQWAYYVVFGSSWIK
ncbi:BamA/TamA family outer membrane protein [Cytophaga aurantiaca]|uniref:BamA/TamA family outer membrane protein n=1 Tax=Cytophaga aurantiaca TaxID=29530 RepID=UPI0003A05836|nr:BamA/TamA family outer membrane protein [Cytophaga aurantiaca]